MVRIHFKNYVAYCNSGYCASMSLVMSADPDDVNVLFFKCIRLAA